MDRKTHNGYKRAFTKWSIVPEHDNYKSTSDHSSSIYILHEKNNQVTFEAKYSKIFNLTLKNDFKGGIPNQGKIEINDELLNIIPGTPLIYEGLDDDEINIKAIDQIISGMEFYFEKWVDNGNTDRSRTIILNSNITIEAQFWGKPQAVTNLHDIGGYYQQIILAWDRHSNPFCKYKIYRQIKDSHGRNLHDGEGYVTTLPNSTTSWQDNLYTKTHGYTDYLLYYDVRAYYTIDETEADPSLLAVFGDYDIPVFLHNDSTITYQFKEESDQDVSISPNPFNPSTTIKFFVEKDGEINASVFDINGRLVKNLRSGFHQKGSYSLKWDGTDYNGNHLASGLYFLHYVSNNMSMTKKLFLIK